jgi:muramoyltetrapeptide carboxypeptidase
MEIIKPEKLKRGDVIGIISPSSPLSDKTRLDAGISYFEKMGYAVKVGTNSKKESGYLAGTDEERVEDIHNMFLDKKVKLIICLRGGYGASRLLDKIDYDIVKNNPKIFCGYSDITVLQNAFYKKTGLITFAGPMVGVDFYKDISEFTEKNFWNTVTGREPIILNGPLGERLSSFRSGIAEGKLIGGNLSMFASLIGTEYLPEAEGKILFLEEIGEVPYRIDRMLNQLRLSGYLGKINGIILGRFIDCIESDPQSKSLKLEEVMDDYFANNFHAPVLNNLSHGHINDNLTIPIGINVKINGIHSSIDILETHLV